MSNDEARPPLIGSTADGETTRGHRSYSFNLDQLKESESNSQPPRAFAARSASERILGTSSNLYGLENDTLTSLSPSSAARDFMPTTEPTRGPLQRQTSAGDVWHAQTRSRSKSSSATFDQETEWTDQSDSTFPTTQAPSLATLLTVNDPPTNPNRRGSAGTISSIWSPAVDSRPQLPERKGVMSGPLPMMPDMYVPLEDSEERSRRYSHSPLQIFDQEGYSQQAVDLRARRHSVGTPILFGKDAHVMGEPVATQQLVEAFSQLKPPRDESNQTQTINDYFENQHNRARAWVEGARNLQQMQQTTYRWPLFVVEFKAGRKDFFHVPDPNCKVAKGDFVMVEADRGEDLGKIVVDNLKNVTELQDYQQQNAANLLDNQFGKDVQPKKILRVASQHELGLLATKISDEERAMSVCQQKVRSKRLPMEVVDAEYQWDRRKLTFYFVADRRIDFRDLVKELFKIYKTRIWLCSCGTNPTGSTVPMPQEPVMPFRPPFGDFYMYGAAPWAMPGVPVSGMPPGIPTMPGMPVYRERYDSREQS